MPEYKNQHYVPRFYFRLFSTDGKHIELYNLKRKKSFPSPIDPMCQKDYFYGKDGDVEKSLGPLETSQAAIIHSIITTQKLPMKPEDYVTLLGFVCLQHSRTESSKIMANESMKLLSDEIVKSLFGKDADCEIVHPAIHLLKMKNALQSIPLIGDLIPVILVNDTQLDFVFSDNPVIFYNTYFNRITKMGTLGLQSPGLQIFCPLSAKVMLMLYDPKYYSIQIGPSYSIKINNKDDIESLNTLQFLNCNENIFYTQQTQENELKKIHLNVQRLAGQRKMRKNILPHPESADKEIIHFYEDKPQYDLKLSFVKLRDNGRKYEMVRNPEIVSKITKDIDTYDKLQSSAFGRAVYKFLMIFKRVKYRLLLHFH